MSKDFRIYEESILKCPHCGQEFDEDYMVELNLFTLAHEEERKPIECQNCDQEFWLRGGWTSQWTTAFAEEDL